MPQRKLYLVAYDVADSSRLRRMLYVIKDYATGGQKSAYECYLSNSEKREMISRVKVELNISDDRFACIEVKESSTPKTLGKAVPPQNLGYFLIE